MLFHMQKPTFDSNLADNFQYIFNSFQRIIAINSSFFFSSLTTKDLISENLDFLFTR